MVLPLEIWQVSVMPNSFVHFELGSTIVKYMLAGSASFAIDECVPFFGRHQDS